MAQIISIYGLVTSVIISNNLIEKMPLHTAFLQLGAGLAVGLCGLAAGFAIGIIGDAGGQYLSPSAPDQPAGHPCHHHSTPRHEWDMRWDRIRTYTYTELIPLHSPRQHTTAAFVCRDGAHPHLRRGARSVRRHRVHPDADQVDDRGYCLSLLSEFVRPSGSRSVTRSVGSAEEVKWGVREG